jgi:hypothetical protein
MIKAIEVDRLDLLALVDQPPADRFDVPGIGR